MIKKVTITLQRPEHQQRRNPKTSHQLNNQKETVEMEELNEQAEKVKNSEDATVIIKKYEEIIRTKTNIIISIAYHQGKVFPKFKEKKFIKLIKQFKVHKTMMIFKINIAKLIDKYPKLIKLLVTLNFSKIYFKDIKEIYSENLDEFK